MYEPGFDDPSENSDTHVTVKVDGKDQRRRIAYIQNGQVYPEASVSERLIFSMGSRLPEIVTVGEADYATLEARILGLTYNGEEDLHRLRAAEMFEVAYEDVTDEQRRAAKADNLRLIYPIGEPRR